jgi:helix-turn-helix, Psq domain
MTRPKNPNAAEKEARIREAITAVLNDEYTCHSAAIAFNVPRRTLYDCVKGNKKPRNQAHERDQNLTYAEEKELVRGLHSLQSPDIPLDMKHCVDSQK